MHKKSSFSSVRTTIAATNQGLRRSAKVSMHITALACVLALIGAPAAYAATYYANNSPTSMNVVRSSGMLSSVSGGDASVVVGDLGAPVQVFVETFHPNPGYKIIGSSSGNGGTTMFHTNATNAYQKCWWAYTAGNVFGTLNTTCYAF